MGCQSDLGLKAVMPDPLFYYPCETVDVFLNETPDTVNGRNLELGVDLTPVSQVAGIIGLALRNTNAFFALSWTRTGAWLDLSGTATGFTFRTWYGRTPGVQPMSDYIMAVWRGSDVSFGAKLTTQTNLLWELDGHTVNAVWPNDAGWHRIMGWYDRANAEIGLQGDDTAPAVGAGPASMVGGASSMILAAPDFLFPGIPTYWQIDEMGLWPVLWSAQERTNDWNGGAGRTWPWM